MKNFYSIVSDMNNDELNSLISAIKDRRNAIGNEKKDWLKVGGKVCFDHSGKHYVGDIREIKRTKAIVNTQFGSYTVPLNMLNKTNES